MTVRILLVDDNTTFMAAVRLFLGMFDGVTVVGEASDGPNALIQAGTLNPDLVLLDIAMPAMNGLEVARRMQSWAKPPRVIFLSMHDTPDYRAAAEQVGSAGYIGKADFVVELFPILKQMTGGAAIQAAN